MLRDIREDTSEARRTFFINNLISSPFPSSIFRWENSWRSIVLTDSYHILAYAGAESLSLPGRDPYLGLLILVTETLCCNEYTIQGPDVYRTPRKVGPVEIVWADQTRLLLASADDTVFLFDVPTRRWLWPPLSVPKAKPILPAVTATAEAQAQEQA